VLPRADGETLEVQTADGGWEPWAEREHWGGSRPSDRHFVLDSVSGELRLGPAIREPDGSERQYGALPARGRQLRFSRYRTGGGAAGNVGVGTLTVLKSSVPYVDRVTNRHAASGGRDAESLEHAKLRAPQMLRTSFRAVTAEDYEYLAAEASPAVARARCVQPRAVRTANAPPPGTLEVLLVPAVAHPEARIGADELRLPPDVLRTVEQYLNERRLLTTVVTLGQPEYRWISVATRLKARADVDGDVVRRDALARLYRFLNPLVGGGDGNGWPWGRDLYISEVYAVLQGTPGVEYIEAVDLVVNGGGSTGGRVSLPPHGLVASAEHDVAVT
jgi:predicted phage baseplate assembly protein